MTGAMSALAACFILQPHAQGFPSLLFHKVEDREQCKDINTFLTKWECLRG